MPKKKTAKRTKADAKKLQKLTQELITEHDERFFRKLAFQCESEAMAKAAKTDCGLIIAHGYAKRIVVSGLNK